jgi:quinol-cytochrome oxidoreductase complex cytochrome b subunit
VTEKNRSRFARLAGWLDDRLGLTYPLLRPVPRYAINPFYWLGALTVVAFLIQGITGMIMMLYYVPNLDDAFRTTQYIFQQVYYGRFLETVHLYTAYAMIMLAFMHLMRGYFVSVHKKPREIMWLVGMVMGFTTLGFGFTGYLLPWTVVSKSATDVGIGMIDALPAQVSSFISFLIVGAGGDATELLRFYDLHVVVLPAVLLILLTVKMYMLEKHGVSEPAAGKPLRDRAVKDLPIFPDVTFYLLGLAAIFGSGMLLISAVFPLNLPPAYTPQLASQYTPQPDWYFLWIYQILKISVFEGAISVGKLSVGGLPIALGLVTLIFLILFLLPFIDRGETRRIRDRPIFVTSGMIFVAELLVLAYWGLVTPGQIIPAEQVALVLGGVALLVAAASLGLYRSLGSQTRGDSGGKKSMSLTFATFHTGLAFTLLVAFGSLSIGISLNSTVGLIMNGTSLPNLIDLAGSVALISTALLFTLFFMYRVELGAGSLERRIRWFEVGLKDNDAS